MEEPRADGPSRSTNDILPSNRRAVESAADVGRGRQQTCEAEPVSGAAVARA